MILLFRNIFQNRRPSTKRSSNNYNNSQQRKDKVQGYKIKIVSRHRKNETVASINFWCRNNSYSEVRPIQWLEWIIAQVVSFTCFSELKKDCPLARLSFMLQVFLMALKLFTCQILFTESKYPTGPKGWRHGCKAIWLIQKFNANLSVALVWSLKTLW